MKGENIIIVVNVVVKPENIDQFIEATNKSQEASLKESSCYVYEIFQDRTEPHKFILVEEYANEEAIEFHRSTPHFQEWRSITFEWMLIPRTSSKLLRR